MTFRAWEKAECAKREVGQRKWVYPKLVASGKMTQQKADKETMMMQEIADEYKAAAERERLL